MQSQLGQGAGVCKEQGPSWDIANGNLRPSLPRSLAPGVWEALPLLAGPLCSFPCWRSPVGRLSPFSVSMCPSPQKGGLLADRGGLSLWGPLGSSQPPPPLQGGTAY